MSEGTTETASEPAKPRKILYQPVQPKTLLSVKEIHAKLLSELGEKVILKHFVPAEECKDPKKKLGGESYVIVAADSIVRICTYLRDEPTLSFDCMMCLGGLDEAAAEGVEPAFTVVYELYSFKHRHRVALHARLPKDNPVIPSVQNVWHAANWFEREAFDLFGIQFENHPDLRRLLLPPDWVGYPLRKDYEFPKEYNGISCVRPKLK